MRKRIGLIFCTLLALAALTFAAVLPASAADSSIIIGVYYYDASGKTIDTIWGMEFTQPVGYDLKNAQVAFDDIAHMAALVGAASTEVRLLADVPTALTVPAGTSTVLNLNGHSLSASGDAAPLTVTAGGTLAVTDTSADKSGSIAYTGTAAVPAIDNRGRLSVETANVSTASSAALISNSESAAYLTIRGGDFTADGGNFENVNGARIAVSGGSFSHAVAEGFCAAGYEPFALDNGRHSVKEAAYDDRFGETLAVVGKTPVTENGVSYYPIDVVCGIDALAYQTVGIEYRVIRTGASPLDTTEKKEQTTVYSAVNLTATDGAQIVCRPADLGASYLYRARLLFDTTAFTEANTVVRVTPYAVGMDGTTVRGRTIELDSEVCAAAGVTLFAKGE